VFELQAQTSESSWGLIDSLGLSTESTIATVTP